MRLPLSCIFSKLSEMGSIGHLLYIPKDGNPVGICRQKTECDTMRIPARKSNFIQLGHRIIMMKSIHV
jgi:hypothetical protein